MIAVWGQAGHWSVGAEQLYCTFFAPVTLALSPYRYNYYYNYYYHYNYYYKYYYLFQLLNCSHHNLQGLPFLSDSPLCQREGYGGNDEWLLGT